MDTNNCSKPMDRRGVEPRTSACKAGAFPLRHPPVSLQSLSNYQHILLHPLTISDRNKAYLVALTILFFTGAQGIEPCLEWSGIIRRPIWPHPPDMLTLNASKFRIAHYCPLQLSHHTNTKRPGLLAIARPGRFELPRSYRAV